MKVSINFHEYAYHCSDGCCFNYGIITTVNGVELPTHNEYGSTMIEQILKQLGHEVETTFSEDIE